jgi:hypothetical protein
MGLTVRRTRTRTELLSSMQQTLAASDTDVDNALKAVESVRGALMRQ